MRPRIPYTSKYPRCNYFPLELHRPRIKERTLPLIIEHIRYYHRIYNPASQFCTASCPACAESRCRSAISRFEVKIQDRNCIPRFIIPRRRGRLTGQNRRTVLWHTTSASAAAKHPARLDEQYVCPSITTSNSCYSIASPATSFLRTRLILAYTIMYTIQKKMPLYTISMNAAILASQLRACQDSNNACKSTSHISQ